MGICVACGKVDRVDVIPPGWYIVVFPRENDTYLHKCLINSQGNNRAMCVCPTCIKKHGKINDNLNVIEKSKMILSKEQPDVETRTRFDFIAEAISGSGSPEPEPEKKKRGRPKKKVE